MSGPRTEPYGTTRRVPDTSSLTCVVCFRSVIYDPKELITFLTR